MEKGLLTSADPAEPLENFGRHLGLDTTSWWRGESLSSIALPQNLGLSAGAVRRCAAEIAATAAAYGDSLTQGALLARGVADDLGLRADLTVEEVVRFADHLGEGIDDPGERDRIEVGLSLEIDKRRLLPEALQAPSPGHRFELIFYVKSLDRLLQVETGDLDSWWEGIDDGRLVLFVPRWDHHLEGPHLAVVGGDLTIAVEALQEPHPERARGDG